MNGCIGGGGLWQSGSYAGRDSGRHGDCALGGRRSVGGVWEKARTSVEGTSRIVEGASKEC